MNAGKYGVFLFVYIKRRVNKETVSICSLLGIAVHKQELVCAKKKILQKKKKNWRFLHKEKMQDPIY